MKEINIRENKADNSFLPRGAERIDLVDEDNGGFMLASKLEKVADELFGFSQPLGNKVRRRNGEESRIIGLGRHGFGQVGFACSWWLKTCEN